MKHLFSLLAISFSTSIFASLPATTDPNLINVPQLPGGMVIGASGFYMQPSPTNGDLDYASLNTGRSSIPNSGSGITKIDPSYDWGWSVNAGYVFPETANDINLSYFRFSSRDNNSAVTGPINTFSSVVFTGPLDDFFFPFDAASADVQYDIHQIDLTAGQLVNVGCRLQLHPTVGLRWAETERTADSTVASNVILVIGLPVVGDGISEKSNFSGIGPLAGLDASYYITHGIGIVGHLDSAVLVGDIFSSQFSTVSFPTSPITVQTDQFQFRDNSDQRIVPMIDAKLGVNYTILYSNTNSDLTLEAGYQTSHYYDAIDRLTTDATLFDGHILSHKTSDLAISGPYVSLTVHAGMI